MDLFYFPDSLAEGAERLRSPHDRGCPYNGLSAPQEMPGTIVVLGHTDRSGAWPRVTGYGIVGFDEETSRPMKVPGASDDRYVVLYRPRMSDFIRWPQWPGWAVMATMNVERLLRTVRQRPPEPTN